MRRFAGVMLLLAAPPALAAFDRGCDAAWIVPTQPVRLVRLDADEAALKVGALVVARAHFGASTAVSQAMQPQAPVAAKLESTNAQRALWRVRGSIEIDDECTLELDANVALEDADGTTTRAANALTLLGQARAASEEAQPERAADLALQALAEVGAVDAQPVLVATIAALAIERLIDQRQLGRALRLAEEIAPQVQRGLDRAQPAALRLELATVRLAAWPEALGTREELQPRLDATFGARSLPALENRVRYANNLMVLGRGRESLDAFATVEVMLRDDPRPAALLRVLLARSHANVLSLQGQQDAQIARLRALRTELAQRYGNGDRRVIDVDDDIARGLADAARLPEALALAARVFLWRDRVLGPAHSRTQESTRLLALLYGRSGRYGSARALLEGLLRRIDPEADMGLTIRAWRDLATWAALDGEPRAALELMGQAHRAARERFSADSIFAIGLAIDYGWLLIRAGETRAGCELLDGVRAHAPAANGLREWADAGFARCLLAGSVENKADTERSIALLASAYGAAKDAVGADNARTLVWQSLLAGAQLRLGRRAEAKQLLTDFVFRAERNREALAAGSAVRDSTFGLWIAENDSMAGYRTLALLYAQDGDLDGSLRVSELARDRQLRDRFAERRWLQLAGDAPDARTLHALQAHRQQLDEAIAIADAATRVRLEAERVGAADAVDVLERQLAVRYPEAASAPTPTVDAIQARLAADTALVAYQHAGDTWWVTLIDRRAAHILPIADGADLAIAAHAWTRSLRGEPVRVWSLPDRHWTLSYTRPAGAVARVTMREVARRMSAALLDPLKVLAARVRRVVVVADDDLVGLPLDALAMDSGGAAVERYEVAYAASFGGWIELRDRSARHDWRRDLLAIGAVDDDADQAAEAASLRTQWAPLPFARSEIAGIRQLFPRDRVRALLDGDANKATLVAANRSGELAGYRFVHFATHAQVEPAFAERAALVLTPSGGNASYLTATELAGLSMNAQLVVLSACDTGVGRFEPGQGLLGFAFAVLAAGNQGAVLSLWPVADETTAHFMARFYRRMRQGVAPAAALTATKREFVRSRDPRERDPRVWAAFLLYGGG